MTDELDLLNLMTVIVLYISLFLCCYSLHPYFVKDNVWILMNDDWEIITGGNSQPV